MLGGAPVIVWKARKVHIAEHQVFFVVLQGIIEWNPNPSQHHCASEGCQWWTLVSHGDTAGPGRPRVDVGLGTCIYIVRTCIERRVGTVGTARLIKGRYVFIYFFQIGKASSILQPTVLVPVIIRWWLREARSHLSFYLKPSFPTLVKPHVNLMVPVQCRDTVASGVAKQLCGSGMVHLASYHWSCGSGCSGTVPRQHGADLTRCG